MNELTAIKYWIAKQLSINIYLDNIQGYYWQGRYCFGITKFVYALIPILNGGKQ